jgi:hypothetical protein
MAPIDTDWSLLNHDDGASGFEAACLGFDSAVGDSDFGFPPVGSAAAVFDRVPVYLMAL